MKSKNNSDLFNVEYDSYSKFGVFGSGFVKGLIISGALIVGGAFIPEAAAIAAITKNVTIAKNIVQVGGAVIGVS